MSLWATGVPGTPHWGKALFYFDAPGGREVGEHPEGEWAHRGAAARRRSHEAVRSAGSWHGAPAPAAGDDDDAPEGDRAIAARRHAGDGGATDAPATA